ncbi:polysaccharide deacetylase family protein [soil metagenome]
MRIRICLFHRVSDQKDPLWPPMTIQHFEKIIQHLKKKFQIIPLNEIDFNSTSVNSKKALAAICFDDGYLDNLQFAAPILEKYKCPATFFVVSDCIDSGHATWTFQFDHSFSHTSVKELHLSAELPAEFKSAYFQSTDERIRFAKKLKPYLKTVSNTIRKEVLAELLSKFNDVEHPKTMMNWKEVNQLQSAGHLIGAHSVSHPLLASMKDEQEIQAEISGAAEKIKIETGIFPFGFAYPVGSYDERVKKITKAAGFKMGFAVDNRIADTSTDDPFALPRLELYQENWFKTRLRMAGSIEKMKSFLK